MGTFGHVIKFERIRQNIKQAQLSEGICSPAYLSKIESNSIVPSVKVQDGLFKRLNIKPSSSSMSEDDYLKRVHTIYFEAIMYKDRKKSATFLKKLQETHFLFKSPSTFYTFQLKLLRLSLIAFDSQQPTQEIIKAISLMKKDFNDYQNFMFKLNLGFFNFMNQNYLHSFNSFEDAQEYAQRGKSEDWEIADLEYALGLVCIYLNKNLESIQYSQQAVSFFKKEFYYTRVIEAYLMLAIGFRRIEKYQDAYDFLLLAKKISTELDMKENIPYISANLGNLLAEQGEFDSAIVNFKECIEITDDNFIKATCMCSIMFAYSKINDLDSVVSWCNAGIDFCSKTPDKPLENIIHHFHCYLALHTNSQEIEQTLKKAITYFDQKNEHEYSHKYALLLARYYISNKKYKNAATYFSLANEFLAKKEKRNYSEDI